MLNPEVSAELEALYGPVDSHFLINRVPEGAAPVNIREQWLDVALPIRRLHVIRAIHDYAGRRFFPVAEDYAEQIDAISGERIGFKMYPIEVRSFDAIDSLERAGREEAAQYWQPFGAALLSFNIQEGIFVNAK